jgi:hypothetical protein
LDFHFWRRQSVVDDEESRGEQEERSQACAQVGKEKGDEEGDQEVAIWQKEKGPLKPTDRGNGPAPTAITANFGGYFGRFCPFRLFFIKMAVASGRNAN